ncbi:WHRN [Lepeophtheirus salmonis]|uniref:WHRN n=1 Tax=Lepeophtheirus salmonis TaxID=72036 RepID=A0A7R8CDQ4_LEPSM|nr:WHRN [Lepeophtheirus salmonis]CAF2778913.1 WHRN [Lepeophtheirus salmonis]
MLSRQESYTPMAGESMKHQRPPLPSLPPPLNLSGSLKTSLTVRRRGLINDSRTSLLGTESSEDGKGEEEEGEEGSGGGESQGEECGNGRGLRGIVRTHFISSESPEWSMVLEKARVLLTPGEFASLRLSISEYEDRTISVETFAQDLLQLLGDEEKSSFFAELRELVRLPDLPIWDRIIYSRSYNEPLGVSSQHLIHQSERLFPSQPCESRPSFLFKGHSSLSRNPLGFFATSRELYSSPLPFDVSSRYRGRGGYGGGIPYPEDKEEEISFLPRGESIYQNTPAPISRAQDYIPLVRSSRLRRRRTLLEEQEEEFTPRTREHRHHMYEYHEMQNNPSHSRALDSSTFRPPSSSGAQINRPTTLIEHDNQIVSIIKCSPSLGIAIEGGVNTLQSLPRIIAIQPNGAAYRTGGLRVGQLIQEVNGINLTGLPHETVARIIAECYAKRNESHLSLLLKNMKPTPAEMRRSYKGQSNAT